MKFDPSEEIDNEKAHFIIRDIVAGGEINISKHAKGRMQERGYSMQDVEYILLRGEITNKEFKDKTQSWAYTIKGDDLEGKYSATAPRKEIRLSHVANYATPACLPP